MEKTTVIKKRLRYVRHSLKDGNNNTIGPKGLALISEKSPEGNYTDLFYGLLYRTVQSVLAIIAAIGCVARTRVHTPIKAIGNDELFADMANDAFKAAVKEGKTNVQAVLASHTEAHIEDYKEIAIAGVKEMLDAMPDDGFGLALGHDPVIPLAAITLGYDFPSLKEMEYLDFVLYDDGTITVEDPRQ
jgi:hypothetical protein